LLLGQEVLSRVHRWVGRTSGSFWNLLPGARQSCDQALPLSSCAFQPTVETSPQFESIASVCVRLERNLFISIRVNKLCLFGSYFISVQHLPHKLAPHQLLDEVTNCPTYRPLGTYLPTGTHPPQAPALPRWPLCFGQNFLLAWKQKGNAKLPHFKNSQAVYLHTQSAKHQPLCNSLVTQVEPSIPCLLLALLSF
jgi:hypothetical protein